MGPRCTPDWSSMPAPTGGPAEGAGGAVVCAAMNGAGGGLEFMVTLEPRRGSAFTGPSGPSPCGFVGFCIAAMASGFCSIIAACCVLMPYIEERYCSHAWLSPLIGAPPEPIGAAPG